MIQLLDHGGVDQSENPAALGAKFSDVSSRSGSQTPETGSEHQHEAVSWIPHHRRSRRESRDLPPGVSAHVASLSMHSDGSFDGSQLSAKSDHTPMIHSLKRY